MPDCSHYDNFHNATQLPVKSMFKTQHIILASQSVSHTSLEQSTLWCGSVNNVVITVDVSDTQLSNCERLHALPFSESCIDDVICRMCMMKIGKENVYMWALSTPKGVLYLWDTAKKCLLSSYTCDNFNIGSSESYNNRYTMYKFYMQQIVHAPTYTGTYTCTFFSWTWPDIMNCIN